MPLDRQYIDRNPTPYNQFPGQQQYLGGGQFAGQGNDPANFGGVPRSFNYGPGEDPRPGFSARQSPMEAGMRTGFRNMVPGASLFMDQPEAGSGQDAWWKKLLAGFPTLGRALFAPLFAGNRAAQAMGRNEFLSPEPESMFNRGMTTVGAGLQYAPGGQGMDLAKNIFTGVQAGRGIADFFGFNPGQALAGAGGYAGGQIGRSIFGSGQEQQGPYVPSSFPFFGQSPFAGGEWRNRGEGAQDAAPTWAQQPNWASSQIPSSFDYERG